MQSWNFSLSTYIPFKWLYSHWLNTASSCKYFLFARRWCWQCWLIIISRQHHHQWWCLHLCVFQLLWGYYNDVILSLRITVLLGLHRHGIRVPHHGLSTAILMEFNHCYFMIQEYLLICKLASLLPLLLFYPFYISYGIIISMEISWTSWLEMIHRVNQWDLQPTRETAKKKMTGRGKAKIFLVTF